MTQSHRGREAAQGPLGREPGRVCSGPAAPAPFSSGFLLLLQSLPQAEEGTEAGGLGAIPALPAGRSLSWAPCHPVGNVGGTDEIWGRRGDAWVPPRDRRGAGAHAGSMGAGHQEAGLGADGAGEAHVTPALPRAPVETSPEPRTGEASAPRSPGGLPSAPPLPWPQGPPAWHARCRHLSSEGQRGGHRCGGTDVRATSVWNTIGVPEPGQRPLPFISLRLSKVF